MKYYVINKSIYIIKRPLCHELLLELEMTKHSSFVFVINENGTINLLKNRFNYITHFFTLERALNFIRAYDSLDSESIHNLGSLEELKFVLSI